MTDLLAAGGLVLVIEGLLWAAAPGLGLRLRYLSDGMSPSARIVGGRVIPERSGYYVGWRMTEALVAERGIAAALRAEAKEFGKAEERAGGVRSA